MSDPWRHLAASETRGDIERPRAALISAENIEQPTLESVLHLLPMPLYSAVEISTNKEMVANAVIDASASIVADGKLREYHRNMRAKRSPKALIIKP